MPDSSDSSSVPSGMDNDPQADEAVVPAGQTRPQHADEDQVLRDAIANAIDGSGSTPVIGDPQAIMTEGTTGPGLRDEDDEDDIDANVRELD